MWKLRPQKSIYLMLTVLEPLYLLKNLQMSWMSAPHYRYNFSADHGRYTDPQTNKGRSWWSSFLQPNKSSFGGDHLRWTEQNIVVKIRKRTRKLNRFFLKATCFEIILIMKITLVKICYCMQASRVKYIYCKNSLRAFCMSLWFAKIDYKCFSTVLFCHPELISSKNERINNQVKINWSN